MSKTIFYFIAGDSNASVVRVEPDEYVDDLKNRIKTSRSSDLKNIDAVKLALYCAGVKQEVFQQTQLRVNELERLSQNLNECVLLDELQKISECFPENTQEKKYFCLVRLPPGELVYSFRAEWRLATGLSLADYLSLPPITSFSSTALTSSNDSSLLTTVRLMLAPAL